MVGKKSGFVCSACGRDLEMQFRGSEGWESRLGWENMSERVCVCAHVCTYVCII